MAAPRVYEPLAQRRTSGFPPPTGHGPSHTLHTDVPACRNATLPSSLLALAAWRSELESDLRSAGVPPAPSAPQALLGSRLRRCLHSNGRSVPFNVLVLGASLTRGNMNCGGPVICRGAHAAESLSWPAELQRLLSAALPGCCVEVHASGYGGHTSATGARSIARFARAGGIEWDAALLDYSINDLVVSRFGRSAPQRTSALAASESMLRRLHHTRVAPLLSETLLQFPPGCDFELTRHRSLYAPLAAHYAVPLVSLQRAACTPPPADRAPHLHWHGGCPRDPDQLELDVPGYNATCYMHPGPSTHAVHARLVAAAMLASLEGAGEAAAEGAAAAAAAEGAAAPAALPATTLSPEHEVAGFDMCAGHWGPVWATDLHSPGANRAAGTFLPVLNEGWRVGQYRPGKPPGWIAAAAGAHVAFNVSGTARRGVLLVDGGHSHFALC